jgi:hypothetical protein
MSFISSSDTSQKLKLIQPLNSKAFIRINQKLARFMPTESYASYFRRHPTYQLTTDNEHEHSQRTDH